VRDLLDERLPVRVGVVHHLQAVGVRRGHASS
jgi:hypothetical protein